MRNQELSKVAVLLFSTALIAHTGCSDDETNPADPTGTSSGGSGAAAGNGGSGASTGGSDGGMGGDGGGDPSSTYEFESRFNSGESAVAYVGQAYRHILIETLNNDINGMTASLDADTYNPATAQAVYDRLNFYYEHDAMTAEMVPLGVETSPAALQSTYGDYGSDARLNNKLAGKDATTDHRDWSTEFVGWTDTTIAAQGGSITSPEGLLQAFMFTLAEQAYQRSLDNIPNEPGTSTPISEVFVTPTGIDLKQIIQKFLLTGITYSQGTDDYLERDPTLPEKGLLASNAQDGDSPYSTLGHHWDEAFGYFGAARDFALYTDEELAGSGGRTDWQGYHDTDGDGAIDLMGERNWGAAVNAGKRDLGATDATDFTMDAITAFRDGRLLILGAGDTLTTAELDQLETHALAAKAAWENALVATVVHYINDTISDTMDIDGMGYSFLDHAKHWSELKGFALGLQFNPDSKLTDAQFAEIHDKIGDAPVLASATMADRTAYIADLEAARDIIMTAYGYSQANVENW